MVDVSSYITVQHKATAWGGRHELNIFVIHLSYYLYLFLRNWITHTAQKFRCVTGGKALSHSKA